MGAAESVAARRKRLGAWATPDELVDLVVDRTVTTDIVRRCGTVHVLDPACGDGRFLRAVAARIRALGGRAVLTGVDVDPRALASARLDDAELILDDARNRPWGDRRFDVVVGNPPFVSQMASATTRGGASALGGGPYADVAAEFLALAVDAARPDGGRVGLLLPQSILASRDAGPVRTHVDGIAEMCWSWWSPVRWFDAEVRVCGLGFERSEGRRPASTPWSAVVTRPAGVPTSPSLQTSGVLGDHAVLNANFRDEYYGLVPAVSDDADGPPLVTTGLIDPGACHWGDRPVRFAKRTFRAPRVDLHLLDPRMQAWAARKLVPKVLAASQTRRIEAVADPNGAWLPGVPVTAVVPSGTMSVWSLAAVLTSPVASLHAWEAAAGTGLSATTVRIGPALLAGVPWPRGSLGGAVAALRRGDVVGCGAHVIRAFGVADGEMDALVSWWAEGLPVGNALSASRHGASVA